MEYKEDTEIEKKGYELSTDETSDVSDSDYDEEEHEDVEFEDFEDKEYEVEEHEHVIPDTSGTATLKLVVKKDEEFQEWMQSIYVTCSYGGEIIGRALSRYVNRDWIRSHFWRDMEEPSEDMASIAFDIFDRYGYLKKEFIEHCVRKGSGVWGEEMDHGRLLLLETISVDAEWRRRGLGMAMAKALIKKAATREGGISFTIVIPGTLYHIVQIEAQSLRSKQEKTALHTRHFDTAVSFCRSLGFRRIGASRCFGLATDPTHKAHELPLVDDYDPPEEKRDMEKETDDESDESPFFRKERLEQKALDRMKERMPLHHAITTLPDPKCVEFLDSHMMTAGVSDEAWHNVNHKRDNILHVAARFGKPLTVRWLIEKVDKGGILRQARNVEGYTPLEALQSVLESSRVSFQHGFMTVCVSDRFRGYQPSSISCLSALKGIENPTPIQLLRLKYGCTCNACIQGFISPRMKFALLSHAEMTHDTMNSDLHEEAGFWCMVNEENIRHVDLDIRRNFLTNKSLRAGFTNVFDYIAGCLRASAIPTTQNVLEIWENSSEWPPVTRNFLERGGTVASALKVVFEYARDQDAKAGDGEFMEIFSDSILELPECRNDHEFGFVALACGIELS